MTSDGRQRRREGVMPYEQLKLENQICFPVYAASRMIIRQYQPYLSELGITYSQYLALMVLWETDGISVNDIAQRLFLNTNTITPVLKRLEAQGLVGRARSAADERRVIVTLTDKGRELEAAAAAVPGRLAADLASEGVTVEDVVRLKAQLDALVKYLVTKSAAVEDEAAEGFDR
jgi:DNA-binding MarR family transcriptional regulator